MSLSTPKSNYDKLHYYFQAYESPTHFITATYLYCIATCLERRVRLQEDHAIYPNEYFCIVGPPGVGKSIVASKLTGHLRSLYSDAEGKEPLIKLVASSVTLEKLYKVMEDFSEIMTGPDGKPMIHSSGSFCLASEMGSLFRRKEQIAELIHLLIACYDCDEKVDYDTKQNGTNIILNSCLSFFGCTTPSWISRNFTDDILDMGIGSRFVFVWGDKKRQNTTFIKFDEGQKLAIEELKEHFRNLKKVCGEMRFSPAAYDFYDNYVQKEQDKYRINKDPKLQYYYERKRVHMLKIAMLFHFSDNLDLVLTDKDLIKALEFMSFLEKDMHKALSSVNVNHNATLADDIYRAILSNKGMKRIQILHDFFGRSADGFEGIEIALKFLQDTNLAKLNPNTQLWEPIKPAASFNEPAP